MAEWKKVLVSGSDVNVAAITASQVPSGDSGDKVLVLTTDGGIKQVAQNVVQGTTTANFQISGSTGNDTFDATADTLIFTGSNGLSTSVSATTGNTSVAINLPEGTVSSSQQVNLVDTIGFTTFSSSFSASIATNEVNISTNNSDILTLQSSIQGLVNSSSQLLTDSSSLATSINTANSDIDGIEASIAALEIFTSSVVVNEQTGSFLVSASVIGTANEIEINANGAQGIQIGLPDSVTIGGRLEAGKLVIQGTEITDIADSIISGSTIQGNALTDTHLFTGSVNITGSLEIDGDNVSISDLEQNNGAGLTSVLIRRFSDGKLFRAGTQLGDEISGSFNAVSASLATTLAGISTDATNTNASDITALQTISASLLASQSEGIRFEDSSNVGGSSALGGTASFEASGTGLGVDISNNGSGTTTVTYSVNPTSIANSVGAFSGSDQLQDVLDSIYVELTDVPISGAAQLQTLGFLTSSNFTQLDGVPLGIISGSDTGDSQGQIKLNNNNVDIEGLSTSDSPTFSGLTITNNLTVNGTTTAIKTDNLNIEDQFILINSGASGNPGGTGERDGGIIVDSGNGKGALLMYNFNRKSWGFKGATDPANGVNFAVESDGISGEVLPDVQVATVTNGGNPSSAPTYGTGNYQKGQMHINTSDSTIWVYV